MLRKTPMIQCVTVNKASIIKGLFLAHCTPVMILNFTPRNFYNARFLVTADYEFYFFHYEDFLKERIQGVSMALTSNTKNSTHLCSLPNTASLILPFAVNAVVSLSNNEYKNLDNVPNLRFSSSLYRTRKLHIRYDQQAKIAVTHPCPHE